MTLFWRNPQWMNKAPVVSSILLEGANLGQLVRMWTEKTAAGQSLISWCMVSAALCIYLQFYRVCTPGQKWAVRMTAFGVAFNAAVILTVVWFRYIVPIL